MKSRLAALARDAVVFRPSRIRKVRPPHLLAGLSEQGNFAIAKGRNIGAFRHIDPDAVMLAGSQVVVIE